MTATEEKVKIKVGIKPVEVESTVVYGPFDEAKKALENKGYRIISLEENARLRINQGAVFLVSRNGNWTREGVIYVRNKGFFLTKNSPIMENPVEATQASRKEIDCYLSDERFEKSLEDSVKLSAKKIPTNRFGENEMTIYAFGEIAEKYGQFLNESGIKEMPVWIASLQEKPSVRQIWFNYLGSRSGLLNVNIHLDFYYRLRGVKFSK